MERKLKRLKVTIYVLLGIIGAILLTFAGFFIWVAAEQETAKKDNLYGVYGVYTVQDFEAGESCFLSDFVLDVSSLDEPSALRAPKKVSVFCTSLGKETECGVKILKRGNRKITLEISVAETVYNLEITVPSDRRSPKTLNVILSDGKERCHFTIERSSY